MGLIVEPLQEEELDEFIRIYWSAFEPLSANMYFPMIYPNGLKPDLIARIRARILRATKGDLASHCFCAKDTSSGSIVAVSWWEEEHDPPQTQGQVDANFAQAYEARNDSPSVEGFQADLDYAAFRAAFYSEAEVMQGRPYMTLKLLATSPGHHRRGAGSLLLKHGLEKADRVGLPVYLATGVTGKPLYERFGFVYQRDMPINCLEYGGRSNGRHWCMLRPAAKEGESET
ncbi:uncharacterized protein LTR77_006260 [Saxophila tyrrhenica]|uniref:N-acetyltransferase domain-containing protein n=1 Tax=Saxophila tyrrhenica TaxID=1690608 RepID=A0AAV9P9I5_9PEZI|nr:hypothetical protein LTR77_006260 [Saxophila tyrrhenica]